MNARAYMCACMKYACIAHLFVIYVCCVCTCSSFGFELVCESVFSVFNLIYKMSGSEEDEHDEIDRDACSAQELSNLFDESMRIASEEAVSLQKDYILYLDHSR